MTPRPRLGVLGGTFDPIHYGHLAAARAAQDALHLERVAFVPSARPPHRPGHPRASGAERLEMVGRAVAGHAGWNASAIELDREGPSYTIDTLESLGRDGLAPSQIFFITGADAFAEIATWHRFPAVLDAAHFVVVTRPGVPLELLRERVPALASRMIDVAGVAAAVGTAIVLLEADTPQVSSTEIRQRAAAGAPLTGLVPSPVADYIAQRQLYRPSGAAAAPVHPDGPGGK